MRPVVGGAVLLASLGYIAISVEKSISELAESDFEVAPASFVALIVGTMVTLLLSAAYHVFTVRRIERSDTSGLAIAVAYSLGQIVRYLPGKIAGVVFQASYLKGGVKPSTVTLALISQTIYDNAWTLLFAGAILLASDFSPLAIATAIALSIVLLAQSHRRAWVERALTRPRLVQKMLSADQDLLLRGHHSALAPTALLVGVWVPFFVGLATLLSGIATPQDAALIGACYLLATVGSMLVFVVPSGIVVREALLIFVGAHFGVEISILVVVGIVLRLALTISEALCAGLLLLIATVQESPKPK